jgi:purine nucleosidase
MADTEIAKTIKGSLECVQDEHASNAIVRIAKEHEGLNMICIGPLTNLAMALRLEPDLPKYLGSLTIMGGTYKGWGNITL